MKHKHYEAIVAFAEGKTIQWKDTGVKWADWPTDGVAPSFHPDNEWRVKPPAKKYRVAECEDDSGVWLIVVEPRDSTYTEAHARFKRWITDWVEYE